FRKEGAAACAAAEQGEPTPRLGCRQPRSPLSACFAHARGSTACAFAIAGETCSKSCTARHLAASFGLPQTSSYSAATIRRTVSITMSRARSSSTQGACDVPGKAGDERNEKLVARPVHHE